MGSPRRAGPAIIRWSALVASSRQGLAGVVMAWLLVVSLAACSGEDYEGAATTSSGTYAAVTSLVAAAARSETTSAAPAPRSTGPATTMEIVTQAETLASTTTVSPDFAEAAAMADDAEAMTAAVEVVTEPEGFPVPPSDTTFKDYQQSGFVPTSQDTTSTFSLDTDRTSYQLALNWAREGYEVEPDSVRAEEWINAFDYEYPHPAHLDSFAILTNLVMHPLDDRKHLARIGFQTPEFRDDRPVNVTLVLDASGSMEEGNRVAIAREAAESIRRSLTDRDRIAVVHFTDDVINEYTVEHGRPDDRQVRDSIQRLAPHNSTNVQAGLDLGVWLAGQARRERPDAYNYVILMSDGVANVNATDPFAILESAYDDDSGNPLRLITIGVGISNYNDYLLEQLAQYGNGWYRYLSDVAQARATFTRENWLALSTPFADQTRAQITWNDEVVESWRMIGYENRITSDESFVEDRKEFAELPVGAATTVFYELTYHDEAYLNPVRTVELASIDLRWVTPTNGRSNRQTTEMLLMAWAVPDFPTADYMLRFGSLVALAADRYGSLPFVGADSGIGRQLRDLEERLGPLAPHLGQLDSFNDFAFLLDRMIASVPVEGSGSSGYSR